MQLEPACAGCDQPLRLVERGGSASRIDARERDQHVGMRGRGSEHVAVGDDRPSGEVLVDGEDHACHAALAIVRGDVVQRQWNAGLAEVAPGGAGDLGFAGVRSVSVNVDVERRQGVDVEGGGAHDPHDPPVF